MSVNKSRYIHQLWNDWVQFQDEHTGNELIQHYMYLVHYHVERTAAYIPDSFDKNDLKSLGIMGLFDALNKFEPKRNLKFDTYATIRIHGAIMDGLRREDWLPRTLRDKSKKIEKITQELQQTYQRAPSAEEIASVAELSTDEVEATVVDTLYANMLSTDSVIQTQDTGEQASIASTIEDQETPSPDDELLKGEVKQELKQAILQLNKNEQLVISLFYIEELTLTEIGEILGLTTSRISQIHKKAIFKLKDLLYKLKKG